MKLKIPLIFAECLHDQSRYELLYGGAGSGKSVFVASKIIYRCLTEGNHKFLILRKVRNSIRESVMAEICARLEALGVEFTFLGYKREIRFRGNVILFEGFDEPEKIKSIKGITGIWIEEATEFTLADFTQLDLRLRDDTGHYLQIILTFNPDAAKGGWIKTVFFDQITEERKKEIFIHHSTADQNPFASKKYLSVLDNIVDATQRKIYKDGIWATMRGIIFTNWDTADTWPSKEKYQKIIYGMDFGYNDPTVLVKCAFGKGNYSSNFYVKQHIYESDLIISDVIKKMNSLNISKSRKIWADAAAPDKIEEIRREGYNIEAAPKNINARITLLKEYKIVIVKSPDIISEISKYKWLEKRGLGGTTDLKDEPIDMFNHAMDAMGYAAHGDYGGSNNFKFFSVSVE